MSIMARLRGVIAIVAFLAPTLACSGLGQDYTFVDPDGAARDGATSDAGDASTKGDALADAVAPPPDGANLCPSAKINHPGTDARAVNTDVPFIGTGRDVDCTPIVGSNLDWVDNLEGQIGQGETFTYKFTKRGSHTVTLTATGQMGGTATASVSFQIF